MYIGEADLVGPPGGEVPERGIRVHPTLTRSDLHAVEPVVDVIVSLGRSVNHTIKH